MPWPPRGDFDPDAARRFRGSDVGGASGTTIRGGRARARPGTAGWVAASLPVGGAALMGTSLPIAIPAGMALAATAAAAAARKKRGLTSGEGGGEGGEDGEPVVHVGAATFIPPHLLDGAGTYGVSVRASPGRARGGAGAAAAGGAAAATPADAAAAGAGLASALTSSLPGSPSGAGGGAGGGAGAKRDRLLQRNAVLRQTGFLEGAEPPTASALPTVFDPLRPDAAAPAGGGAADEALPPPAAAAAVAAAVAGGGGGGPDGGLLGPLSPATSLGRRRTSEVSEPRPAPARPAAVADGSGGGGSAGRSAGAGRASALSLALGTPPAGVAGSGPRPAAVQQ